MNGDNYILLNVLGLLLIAALSIGLTALYWRRILKRIRTASHQEKMRRLVDSRRAEQKLRLKAEFTINILQEVQTLQVGLDSYLKLFADPDMSIPPNVWERTSRLLQRRAAQMQAMVDGGLVVMQYDELSEVPRDDMVAVNVFCQDVFNSCMKYLRNGVETAFETSLPDDYIIKTNMSCLDLLLRCLILCSMEYTTKGHITLKVIADNTCGKLVFTLNDTGLGIPEDTKNQVFDRLPYDTVENKITGLRLRTCKAMVRLLGGAIHVDPRYEEGTSMVFSIYAAGPGG